MKKYKIIVVFVIVCVAVFCYSYFYSTLFLDEIWNYGFSYNIVKGLIPYKDFNMIVTPFYSFLGALFIQVFGHHLWSIHILNSLMISLMMLLMYFNIGKRVLFYFPILLLYCYPGYNLFCLFLMIILIMICEKEFKNKDVVLGLLCGIFFLTKQTVGICMFIPMIYYSKNKLKSFVSYCVPILLFVIYLLFYNAFYQFIDYCFLGMFDFGEQNRIFLFLPIEIIICILLGYMLIKSRFSDKKLFYILMFQIMTVPIVDDYHFMIGFLSVYYWFLERVKVKKYQIKYYFVIILFATWYWNYMANGYGNFHFYGDKSSYLYGRYVEKYIEVGMTDISDYMEFVKDDYDRVFLFTQNSYMIKLNTSYLLNKFDLINNGNMGYHGDKKYIRELDELCSRVTCLFITYHFEINDDNPKGSQTSSKIIDYVYENYNKIGEEGSFDLYDNLA